MKIKSVRSFVGAVIGSLLLVGSTVSAQSLTNLFPFNTEGEFTNDLSTVRLWGGYGWSSAQSWVLSWTAIPTNEWDSTRDAGGSPSSGSLRQHYDWPSVNPGDFQQAFDFVNLVLPPNGPNAGPINFFKDYSYCAIDTRFDPASTLNTNGNYGEYFVISITVRTNNDLTTTEDWDDVFRLTPTSSDAGRWITYKGAPPARQTNVCAFFTGLQGVGYTGPILANVDNLRFFKAPAAASTNLVLFPFNNEGEFTNDLSVVRLWGGYGWSSAQSWVLSWTAIPTNEYDFFRDANNASGSGSLRQHYDWPSVNPSDFQQAFDFVNLVTTNWPNRGPINFFRDFAAGSIDVRFDPSSTLTTATNYGEYFVIAITVRTNNDLTTTEDWDDVFRLTPPASPGQWVTFSGAPVARQTNVCAFFTGLQGTGYTGPILVNVDNLRFSSPPAPPPQLAIEKAAGGLEFVPAATLARPDPTTFIMSVAPQFTTPSLNWMDYTDSGTGNPVPVTYALNISKFPDAAHSNFVAHMIIAPYSSVPEGWRTRPEVDLANVIYLTITNKSDGSASASLVYKVNSATSNNNWTVLGSLNSPSPLGTWSVTLNNTNVTLKAPNASVANSTITDSDVLLFNDGFTPIRTWVGVQPRVAANFNQMAVFSSFKVSYVDSVTGVNVVTNETWSTEYANNWIEASDCVAILPRPTNSVYRVSWTGPATGYTLQQSTSIASGYTPTGLAVGTSNTRKVSFVTSNILPSLRDFYRLYNPTP